MLRVLRLNFSSPKDFLAHFSDRSPEGLVFCWTRAELQRHERVLAELDFPGLPNQVLVRAHVESLGGDQGAWLRFDYDDRSTVDFMLGIARGDIEVSEKTPRRHERFPADHKAKLTIAEKPQVVGLAEDLSAGGAFVRIDSPPAKGTPVRLELESEGGAAIELLGEVAWVRDGGTQDPGVGIRFHRDASDVKRLRTLLRRARETGEIESLLN